MPHSSGRKIIHIDMDAFYASVEQRDNSLIQGKPVVVGGDPKSRGVVASASYEARKFGIRSAMSCSQAYRLCPQAVFIYPCFDKYVSISQELRAIFESITDRVEPLALDEAYLDVTQNHQQQSLAKTLAIEIKKTIRTQLNLTASAGVGPNKFIAKLASEFNKPDGLVVVPPEKVFQFVENLPVEKFWGVGPATARKLQENGIKSAVDLRSRSVLALEKIVGSYAFFLHELAHGRDDREVEAQLEPKSRGTETTFEKDSLNSNELLKVLETQAEEISQELKRLGRPGRTVTLKVKYSDFTAITRSRTVVDPLFRASEIYALTSELLLNHTQVGSQPIRLIGTSVSSLIHPDDPLQLWFDYGKEIE